MSVFKILYRIVKRINFNLLRIINNIISNIVIAGNNVSVGANFKTFGYPEIQVWSTW